MLTVCRWSTIIGCGSWTKIIWSGGHCQNFGRKQSVVNDLHMGERSLKRDNRKIGQDHNKYIYVWPSVTQSYCV